MITRERRIISTGYVGSPAGQLHCLDEGCLIDPIYKGCIRTVHAEKNAIFFAVRGGINLVESSLFVTLSPCRNCAVDIVLARIKEVIYLQEYRLTDGLLYLQENGVMTYEFRDRIPGID